MRFDEFMADDIATVERIYDLADQDFDRRTRASIANYAVAHQRDRHGDVIYDLGDFGLDPDERPRRSLLHRPLPRLDDGDFG